VLKWLSMAAIIASTVCWVIAFVTTPSPKWVWVTGSVAFAVGFVSLLLYNLVNHLVGNPIEPPFHWEAETPTSESGTNNIFRNALFPLLIVAALVWLALH